MIFTSSLPIFSAGARRTRSTASPIRPACASNTLQRFLEALGIGKAYFVGNSAGGGLILRASVRHPAPLQIHKMVTICGNASVFKTNSQADLENYTPSMDNMKKIVQLLYHDPKWHTDENIRERYESSIIPGAWETLSAARLRSPVHQARATTEEFVKQLSQLTIPLLIMSCAHDPLNQPRLGHQFSKDRARLEGSSLHALVPRAADRRDRGVQPGFDGVPASLRF